MNPTSQLSQMAQKIERLEARLQSLERLLSGAAGPVVLKSGSSSITLNKARILIQGHDIVIKSSGELKLSSAKDLAIKANGNVDIKGSKVSAN